jgi:hypothetical protein
MLRTNIYRLKNGDVVDVTDKNDVLIWNGKIGLWDHSHKPAPDLGDAIELDCEDLIIERIPKKTKMTEIEGPKIYAITERRPNGELGTLVEANNLYAYSPSLKAWIRPHMAVIDALEATIISQEEAEKLIKAGTTNDPRKQKGA